MQVGFHRGFPTMAIAAILLASGASVQPASAAGGAPAQQPAAGMNADTMTGGNPLPGSALPSGAQAKPASPVASPPQFGPPPGGTPGGGTSGELPTRR